MQQFVVPQFIDIEDKIIGPITTRQFIILLADGFLIFLSYRFADFTLFLILLVILLIVGIGLAFVRVNGRPFHFFLLNLLQTFGRPALRIWRKQFTDEEIRHDILPGRARAATPTLVRRASPASSRLSELSLIVDTGGAYRGDQ
jgi:hypothetical protein